MIPQKSTRSPVAITSGTVMPRAAAISSRVGLRGSEGAWCSIRDFREREVMAECPPARPFYPCEPPGRNPVNDAVCRWMICFTLCTKDFLNGTFWLTGFAETAPITNDFSWTLTPAEPTSRPSRVRPLAPGVGPDLTVERAPAGDRADEAELLSLASGPQTKLH